LVAHGTEDPVISIEYAQRARTLFASSNAQARFNEYKIGHTISEESLADAIHWMQPLLLPDAPQGSR
jgi:predicted esterase